MPIQNLQKYPRRGGGGGVPCLFTFSQNGAISSNAIVRSSKEEFVPNFKTREVYFISAVMAQVRWLLWVWLEETTTGNQSAELRFLFYRERLGARSARSKYERALNHLNLYLALISRAGGLYGRILTEVVSTDRTQWGLYTRPSSRFSHTDWLSSVNKMFIIWQNKNNIIRLR